MRNFDVRPTQALEGPLRELQGEISAEIKPLSHDVQVKDQHDDD